MLTADARARVGKSRFNVTRIASCYAVLGDRDEFFSWIDRAIPTRTITMSNLRYLPFYDKVRDDPRFTEIFKKLGLPY